MFYVLSIYCNIPKNLSLNGYLGKYSFGHPVCSLHKKVDNLFCLSQYQFRATRRKKNTILLLMFLYILVKWSPSLSMDALNL